MPSAPPCAPAVDLEAPTRDGTIYRHFRNVFFATFDRAPSSLDIDRLRFETERFRASRGGRIVLIVQLVHQIAPPSGTIRGPLLRLIQSLEASASHGALVIDTESFAGRLVCATHVERHRRSGTAPSVEICSCIVEAVTKMQPHVEGDITSLELLTASGAVRVPNGDASAIGGEDAPPTLPEPADALSCWR